MNTPKAQTWLIWFYGNRISAIENSHLVIAITNNKASNTLCCTVIEIDGNMFSYP